MTMKDSLLISKSGATLVEVMIALIIIAIVILGGGMFFFYGRVIIIREAHRRAAVLVASQRLEELKATDYSEINFDSGGDYDDYHIVCKEGDWYIMDSEGNWWIWSGGDFVSCSTPYAEEPQEPVDVDNLSKDSATHPTMVTEAKWMDDESDGLVDEGSDDSYDYLEIMVMVNWHDSTDNSVSLTTLIGP